MKAASYGRVLFGASAVLFGVITLLWHDPDTWQGLPILKLGAVVAGIFAVAQIAGGLLILLPRTARLGSIVLGVVYVLFALGDVTRIVAKPAAFDLYDGLFEWISLVSGALAAYAVTEFAAARSAVLGRAARFGIGASTVMFALAQAKYLKFTASLVPAWIPPNQMFWAVATTIAFALAAVAILINVRARLALRLMTVMIALFGLLIWVPAVAAHPEMHGNWSEGALNFLITGAAGLVAELPSF